jgi:DNA-binding winged helix-turn-helix (wHTH) protein
VRYAVGGLVLDTDRFELLSGDDVVAVEPQVFDVLVHLVANHDRVVSKEELLDHVWGSRFVSESALTTRVKQARRALGDDGARQQAIKTVHGRGYRVVAEVEVLSTAGGQDDGDRTSVQDPSLGLGFGSVPETRYVDHDGASIAFQTFGHGPDLVLISGFATNVDLQWEHPALAPGSPTGCRPARCRRSSSARLTSGR